jgi:hypothetical protein
MCPPKMPRIQAPTAPAMVAPPPPPLANQTASDFRTAEVADMQPGSKRTSLIIPRQPTKSSPGMNTKV